jgi:hypothetical protein
MQEKKSNNEEIISRVKSAMAAIGITNVSRLDKDLGLNNTAGKYLKPDGLNIRNLLDKMSNRYGLNLDWLLNGTGPMMTKDIVGRDEESKQFEELGRMAYALIKKAQEIGTNIEENDSTADCRLPTAASDPMTDDRPFVMPPPRQQAGPPPSSAVFERAAQEGMRVPIRRS